MATFTLSACPAWRSRDPLGTSIQSWPMQRLGTSQRIEARNIAEISAAVAGFGKQLAAEHPDASFSIFALIARGGRKPNGFDNAYRRGALGTEAWLQLRDRDGNKLPEQADAAPAADMAA